MKMTRLIFFLFCWLIPLFSNAGENLVKIAGGPKTGEYIHIAEALCPTLGKLFTCEPVETSGTLDNKKRLESGETTFALAKSNVAEEWMKDPNFSSKHTIIRRIGDESLFVFGKPETLEAVGSWVGIRENALLLSVGLPGEQSGDAAVFNTLKSIPGSPLANMEVKVLKDRPALVEAVKSGDVKLGFVVQVPNPSNALFTAINNSGLMIMGVVDPDMITFGDTFRIKAVTVKNAKWLGLRGGAKQIETANVPVAIVATKPEALSDERAKKVQESAIKKFTEIPEADLLPKQTWMRELTNAATLKAGSGLEKVMTSVKESAAGAKERLEKLYNGSK